MLGGDDEAAANTSASLLSEDRVVHGWDPERRVATLFGECLGLQCPAWDVYLLYGPDVAWEGDVPPDPTFGMLQLPEQVGADPSQILNPGRIGEELRNLLDEERRPDLGLRLHAKALAAVRGAATSRLPTHD